MLHLQLREMTESQETGISISDSKKLFWLKMVPLEFGVIIMEFSCLTLFCRHQLLTLLSKFRLSLAELRYDLLLMCCMLFYDAGRNKLYYD